jgi:hypothetical protein
MVRGVLAQGQVDPVLMEDSQLVPEGQNLGRDDGTGAEAGDHGTNEKPDQGEHPEKMTEVWTHESKTGSPGTL